ncbi:hypothetical protein A3K48_03690 [candidate division WOR-1 bacterium RIFOXYA12_FULL_52_29]|uniref:Permease n=1 Tax=candidate division WOR-1 bacterium RIFOXYC12_FULL_54_18 TaxID=1802584 RepID=A0A1F4T6A2_UNCSA|nr:MAG: hypothetical protein A3K44_03690 [candidate division WOR-1 bacterium RIFOXYA2_FULL_51_19]OGC17663.1 MAG: hypothetical protein A3K48_03690 [candidate division WOR-1 bacterium RIFOXYA12_FULL_52_29]OGC26520.1 MAG: hypothetical protein A3K32_03685 [candidate division WOR-1 bacterium RIFOXYB2_FULL_45_9]OGC28080.1 MAG: hypothetical protein A3K49_03690 [candidate division WOR-1 bacterium RIFOXYC12_FULL_54_18]OGC29634.1 MAG: hypothetical protein A2346_02645 [candidate division WOR-1 bacterium R
MQILIAITVICIFLSLAVDQKITIEGITRGLKMFFDLLPSLLTVLALVSVFLYLVPDETIILLLGSKSGAMGIAIAAMVGSIALIPAFIAFPIAKILMVKGVSYPVVAVFITTLIMVGVLTLPIEIKYFGKKAALMRNGLSFFGALIVGLLIGIFL